LFFEVVASQPQTFTVNSYDFLPVYLPVYMVNVTATDGGTVSGAGGFTRGSEVTVTAVPVEGYRFAGWYENNRILVDAGAVYTFTALANRNLEARYEILSGGVPWNSDLRIPDLNAFTEYLGDIITLTIQRFQDPNDDGVRITQLSGLENLIQSVILGFALEGRSWSQITANMSTVWFRDTVRQVLEADANR
jgi:hypothetical protein